MVGMACCGCCKGACCYDVEGTPTCSKETLEDCIALSGQWQGPGTSCTGEDECPCDPPAEHGECQRCIDGDVVTNDPDYCCGGACEGACVQTAGYTPSSPDVDCPELTGCECFGWCTKYAHSVCGYFYYGTWDFDQDPPVHTAWEGNPDYAPASVQQWLDDIAACVESLPEEAADPPEGYGSPDGGGTASQTSVEMLCSECVPDESTAYWTCVTICQGQCGGENFPAALQAPAHGPGTELKALLKKIGIVASPTCSCNKRAKVMDEKGCDWCEEHIDEIDGWLAEEAKKRKLPYLSVAGKTLIRLAIRRARKKGNSH